MMKWGWIFGLGCYLVMGGCTQVDDYFLGKDNTPTPAALSDIKSIIHFKPLWSAKVGGHLQNAPDKLRPVVHAGVIYVALTNGQVQARDFKTGNLRWSQKLITGITSGPAIGPGVLALGTRASSLVMLNLQDGHVRWEKKLSGEMLAQPVISAGMVFVKTVDGTVYAFKVRDGSRVWLLQHGSPELILKASSSPVVLPHQWLLVGFPDGKLNAINAQTGQVIWEKSIGFSTGASEVERLVDIDADPILFQHSILIGTYQGFVGAMSLENGEFIWQKPMSVYKNMEVGSGRLYLSDDNDNIWSINPNNGQVYWKQVKLKVRGLTSPAWSTHGILVGDNMGWLHILSIRDGVLIGRVKVGGGLIAPPVVMGNRVLVLTQTGQLHVFEIESGENV